MSFFDDKKGYRIQNGKLVYRECKKDLSVKLIVAAVICLFFGSFSVYSVLRKDITICDIDTSSKVITFCATVEDVLKEKNIDIRPQDRINHALEEKLKDGMEIIVTRANIVTINVDGKEQKVITLKKTVEGALKDANIELSDKDRVEPQLKSEVKGDISVKIIRVTEELSCQIQELKFTNEVKKNEKLDIGAVNVVKKGENGKKEVTIKTIYEDGIEVAKEVFSEKILKPAVNGIIEEGTKCILTTSRGEQKRFKKAMIMTATAYDATYESCGKHPDHPQYGITYSGLKVKPGIVAVDPNVIPLGTYLYVEGYGEALAADIGGAIKGNRIDLYYESPSVVDKFGKKKVKVYVLDKPRYKF